MSCSIFELYDGKKPQVLHAFDTVLLLPCFSDWCVWQTVDNWIIITQHNHKHIQVGYRQKHTLTKWAAFIPCAVHGAVRLHLQVVSMLAVQPSNNALQLWLCKRAQENNIVLDRCRRQRMRPERHSLNYRARKRKDLNAWTKEKFYCVKYLMLKHGFCISKMLKYFIFYFSVQ